MEKNKITKIILVIILVIVILVVAGFLFINSAKAPTGVEDATVSQGEALDDNPAFIKQAQEYFNSSSTNVVVSDLKFKFTGFGPAGKTESGTFKKIEPSALGVNKDGQVISGSVIIDVGSVSTDAAGLEKHLCSADFFDCTTYKDITFVLNSYKEKSAGVYDITGLLDFHGVQKTITFTSTKKAETVSSDFLLDLTPFNIKYPGVDKKARINFSFSVKQI